jgi:site-specific recombinase XerD
MSKALTRTNDVPLTTPQAGDPWAACAADWRASLLRRSDSQHTVRAYEAAWRGLLDFSGKHPAAIGPADLDAWLAELARSKCCPTTLAARLSAVGSFYTFARKRGLCEANPATAVTRPKVNPYAHAQGLSPEQARALLGAARRRGGLQGLRDHALLLTYLLTAHRQTTILGLRWGDLEVDGQSVAYRYRGKGGKEGRRVLPPPVWIAIKAYLDASGRELQADSPIFTATPEGRQRGRRLPGAGDGERPLSDTAFASILRHYARKAGLEPGAIHAHTLRHTAAKLRRQAGASLEEVKDLLGHSNLATTAIYLNRIEAAEDPKWRETAALLGV